MSSRHRIRRRLPCIALAVAFIASASGLPRSSGAAPAPAPKSAKRRIYALPMPLKLPSAGRLRVQTDFAFSSWDWNSDGLRIPGMLLQAVHRGLYRMAADGSLERDLVESESASDDARTWTFRLKSDVLWSDETPFTPAHAVAGLHRAAHSSSPLPPDAVREIEGFEDFRTMKSPTISGIGTKWGRRITIRLKAPDPDFPAKLADPQTMPARPDLAETHSDYGTNVAHMAFLGPWMPIESYASLRAKLRVNPGFGEGRRFREIELWHIPGARTAADLYARNHLDFLLGPIEEIGAEGVRQTARPSVVALVRAPSLDSRCPAACMRAISNAIDRSRLARLRPADSLVPPELWRAQQLGEFPEAARVRADSAAKPSKLAPRIPPLTIGVDSENLAPGDHSLLMEVARSAAESLRRRLRVPVRILASGQIESAGLVLQLTEARSPALDTFLIAVTGERWETEWQKWNQLPVRSPERREKFAALAARITTEEAAVIPLGWGLDWTRTKSTLSGPPPL